ncbi:helix-turn-helix transcriptional regulator [Fulvivirgaceae bacterium BMA12]|uniref:Helix-turn-helix transcriptional regulator n=1 Tax=Agaribacillus aureus TaxID=3051825 RepID=A0ABT8L072_9BACT|nr:helix-turn-helix transcriptional regulator [Fulvivirgaceae bacterium BMA12]
MESLKNNCIKSTSEDNRPVNGSEALPYQKSAKYREISLMKIERIRNEIQYMIANKEKYDSLTKREIEIIGLLIDGKNNPQIAEQLFISRRTVEQHRKNINRKLEIKCYADLFRFGYTFDLFPM